MKIQVSEEALKKRGDVDGDGEVSVVDATFIQRFEATIPIPCKMNDYLTAEKAKISIGGVPYANRSS